VRHVRKRPANARLDLRLHRPLREHSISASGDVMTIRTSYPYQTLQIRTVDARLVLDLWAVYVPLDREQRTTRAYGLVSIKRPRVRVLLDLAWPLLIWFTERIFKEDRWAVEREQQAHDAQGADWNRIAQPVAALRGAAAGRGIALETQQL
jgi:renierapurpurin 18,18'-hydroxylase